MLLLFYPQKSQSPPPLRFLRLIRCKDTKKTSNGCYLQEKRRKRLNFVAHLRNILSFCNRNKKKKWNKRYFEFDLLEEAPDFLKSLTKEIRGKIGYF